MSVNEKSIANLRPVTSTEEARERGKKGGQKSGEVRRQRKKFKETLELLLHLPPGLSDQKETLLALGVDEDDCDNQTLIAISMIQSAAAGDVKAAAWVRDTVGEKPTDKVDAVIATSPLDEKLAELSQEELRKIAGLD
ncbi:MULTISPECIES: hypothetical protein [Erysipelotrichaceae]|uniref:Uncharacterized protein n=1 Tax=[Eubacterium] hominis TaxID=2764325 RepID=A0A7G9GNN5_9FIRM|nr:hypothetical protein [Absiella sp. AM27-20]MCR0568352.1 hypothetical protein [[Clostridium] innocuum]MCR0577088.1 hypothetical protein [[Clostridium] innocuum]QNM12417.1 hypothetical protein H9Q80_00225 [[Eubacterium] hominis]RHU10662.1 hypothetical protein DW716_01185 [Absiella sp. AM27-20]